MTSHIEVYRPVARIKDDDPFQGPTWVWLEGVDYLTDRTLDHGVELYVRETVECDFVQLPTDEDYT